MSKKLAAFFPSSPKGGGGDSDSVTELKTVRSGPKFYKYEGQSTKTRRGNYKFVPKFQLDEEEDDGFGDNDLVIEFQSARNADGSKRSPALGSQTERTGSEGSHDSHVTRDHQQTSALSLRPPRASCRSARPPSLASSMNSARARSSARRPTTDLSVLSGSKVHTVIENDDAEDSPTSTTEAAATSTTSSSPVTTTTTNITTANNISNANLLTIATTSMSSTASSTPSSSRCSSSRRGFRLARILGGGGGGGGLRGGGSGSKSSRPDSGIVVSSCSASSSSEAAGRVTVDGDLADFSAQTEWITTSLEMLQQILLVRTENHDTIKSLVDAITHGSTSEQLKAHALYRWLASQSRAYYAKCTSAKSSSPTGKMRQLAEGKICYAALYKEMARAAGLKCEKIDGYAKGPDYRPGAPIGGSSHLHTHSWNVIFLEGHYHFLDAEFGALPCKFFVEHFFMTPPDEMRLSHFPKDKRWLLMTQSLSLQDFEATLKTWPIMFAFNIRPLNMRSVLRSYDGRLSITVLLRNVAVSPQLEYIGPGTPQDAEALAFNIDQEIRNVDNAETFHLNLPEEGTYFFTLMVHDLEEDEDIPAFQYRVEYKDELL